MMTMRLCLLFIFAALASVLSGCRSGSHNNPDVLVRFINAAPNAENLTVAVNDSKVWKNAAYRSNTGYQGLGEGTYDITLQSHAGMPVVALKPLSFRKGTAYTLIAFGVREGTTTTTRAHILQDERDMPIPKGKVKLRVINAAIGVDSFDVAFNDIVGVKTVTFGKRADPLLLDDGDYEIKIMPANSFTRSLIGPVSVHLESGHAYTIVAMGDGAHGNLTIETYRDDQ